MQDTSDMPPPQALRLWEFEFGLEVSTLYHDGRRATLGTSVTVVRGVSLVGAIVALIFLLVGTAAWPIVLATGAVAIVTLIDLVFGFDARARLHTDLYRRFKALQADVARDRDNWEQQIGDWEADAQTIRSDEPPVLFGVYAMCWNQVVERRQVGRQHLRRIEGMQYALRHFLQFRPQDFPLETEPRTA